MDNIKHDNSSHTTTREGYHAIVKPFPRKIPELNAISKIQFTRAHPPIQLNKSKAPTLAIVFPRRGGQRFNVDDEWYAPRGGEMLLMPQGARIKTGDELITRIEGHDLYLQMDSTRPFLGHPQHEPIRERLLEVRTTVAKAPGSAHDMLRKIYQSAESPNDPLAISRITLLLGVLLMDVLDAIDSEQPAGGVSYVDEAEQFMLRNLSEPMNLSALVDHTGYSRSALIEAFRRERGVPPMEWFLRLRIRSACERLESTDHSVSTISTELGFSSSQYFATVFKRFMSVSPTVYRDEKRA